MPSVLFRSVHDTLPAPEFVYVVVFQTPPSLPVKRVVESGEKTKACVSACTFVLCWAHEAPPLSEIHTGNPMPLPPATTILELEGSTAIARSYQHCPSQMSGVLASSVQSVHPSTVVERPRR